MNAPRIITAKTRGNVCYAFGIVGEELLEQPIRVRNSPLAKMLAEKIHVLALRNEEWTFERVVQHARDELEWAVAAQARRRFGSAFARGCA